jgi:hypothetical protein
MERQSSHTLGRAAFALGLGFLGLVGPALAGGVDGGINFHDIAANGGAGVAYHRTPSVTVAVRHALEASSPIPLNTFVTNQGSFTPQKDHGDPGVAIFDYDNDGYLDIYVTNGPGTPNSLYHNLLGKTGVLQFEDVAAAAGVTATVADSTGVCAGDIDNDGWTDLYVVGVNNSHNYLFHNNGNGTFSDITTSAGVAGDGRNAAACTMGDFDGDGLLDIFVANTHADWSQRDVVLTPEFYDARIQHNQLFMNHSTFGDDEHGHDNSHGDSRSLSNVRGSDDHGNGHGDDHHGAHIVFADESVARGITNFAGLNGDPTYTWAAAAVDYDGDGDVDIIEADSQGSMARPMVGLNRIFENDGTGHFTDVTLDRGLTAQGSWMGLSFGDYNCDGYLDFFSTNLGRYVGGRTNNSRWFYGSASKVFSDPGITTVPNGGIGGTPFGWGTASFDYDNDGDQDILWYGDEDLVQFLAADNPGTLLRNSGLCTGDFQWDGTSTLDRDNRLRQVQGVAFGDLNNDGFVDVVNVASLQIVPVLTPTNRFLLYTAVLGPVPNVFSGVASIEVLYTTFTNPGFLTYVPTALPDGDLSIEINSANNGNHWAKVDLVGTKFAGVGRNNRDGAGALVRFTPDGGKTIIRPVTDGESHASTSSRQVNVGLGAAVQGTVEVDWPSPHGPVRNKLYDVRAGEKILFPEIPCSYDVVGQSRKDFDKCVKSSLDQLSDDDNGIVGKGHAKELFRKRFEDNMLRAFDASTH